MANETMLKACHLLNQCDRCSRKVKYRNSMKIEEQMGACEGCHFYEDMKQLRPLIDTGIPDHFKRILAKGEDMTTNEVIYLIKRGVKKKDIQEALNMRRKSFDIMLYRLGLAKEKAASE